MTGGQGTGGRDWSLFGRELMKAGSLRGKELWRGGANMD